MKIGYIINYIKCIIKRFITLCFKYYNLKYNVVIGKKSWIKFMNIKGESKGNLIYIEDNVTLSNCKIIFKGTGNNLIIRDGVQLHNATFWFEDKSNSIEIGKGSTFHGNIQLAACEGTSIKIGDKCMFSHDIFVRTTDSHSILYNNKRINQAEDIFIGNNVWIGMQCLILKGANIPKGCIIGARSVVTKSSMNSNCIYVGQPVKCVKSNVIWTKERQ